MSDSNQVRISGTAADTPLLRYTERGTAEAHFSLALRQTFRDAAGQPFVKTLFVCVAAWRELAIEVTSSVKRGRPVEVEGYLARWDPRKGDGKGAQIGVMATRIETEVQSSRCGETPRP